MQPSGLPPPILIQGVPPPPVQMPAPVQIQNVVQMPVLRQPAPAQPGSVQVNPEDVKFFADMDRIYNGSDQAARMAQDIVNKGNRFLLGTTTSAFRKVIDAIAADGIAAFA